MRKEFVIIALIIFILILAGNFLHKGENDDVSIVSLNTPPKLGLSTIGQLEVVLQNNESQMVNINLDIENAFVDENGVGLSTSRMIISSISDESQNVYDYDSQSEHITISPGENKVQVLLGYEATGNYDVKVKLRQNEQVLDEKTTSIQVLPPELSVELEYSEDQTDGLLVYMIEGYISNKGPGRAKNVDTTIKISNLESGEILSSVNYDHGVGGNTKTSLGEWRDLPAAIIELSDTGNSDKSYMPLESVVKGKKGEAYCVTVEVRWNDQNVSSEVIIPTGYEQKGDYL